MMAWVWFRGVIQHRLCTPFFAVKRAVVLMVVWVLFRGVITVSRGFALLSLQ